MEWDLNHIGQTSKLYFYILGYIAKHEGNNNYYRFQNRLTMMTTTTIVYKDTYTSLVLHVELLSRSGIHRHTNIS